MYLYYVKFGNKKELSSFIQFCITYNVFIYFTWSVETLFNDTEFHATITDQPDAKISTEEKARLINETYNRNLYQKFELAKPILKPENAN